MRLLVLSANEQFKIIMKKYTIIAALLGLAGSAAAGSPSPFAEVKPSHFGENTQPATETRDYTRFGWEVKAAYNHALTDINKCISSPSIDTWGFDLTGVYKLQGNHKLTFTFGYARGEDAGYDLQSFMFMPGYRYEKPVNEKWTAFAGAGLGLGVFMLEHPFGHGHDDMMNLQFNVEVGARYAITPKIDLVGSVLLNAGTDTLNCVDYVYASEEQVNLGFRLGIGGSF